VYGSGGGVGGCGRKGWGMNNVGTDGLFSEICWGRILANYKKRCGKEGRMCVGWGLSMC